MLELRFRIDVNEDGTCGVGCPFHMIDSRHDPAIHWCSIYMPSVKTYGKGMVRAEECKRQAVEVEE